MAKDYPKLPEGYTKAKVHLLKTACEYYYPIGVFGNKDQRAFGQGQFGKWKNSSEFKKELFGIFPEIEDISEIHEILEQWEVVAPDEVKPNEQPSSTVPDKDKLEQLQKEADERERIAKEAREKAKTETVKEIEELQKNRKKFVYLEPKTTSRVELTSEEKIAQEYLEKAAQADPETFIKTFSEKIIKSTSAETKAAIGEEALSVSANQVAIDFLNRTLNKNKIINAPAGIFKGLLESDIVSEALKKETLSTLSILSSSSEGLTRSFLYPILGKNLTDFYYEKPQIDYTVTTTPTSKSVYQVNLFDLQKDFTNFKNNPVFSFLEDQAKDELLKHGKKLATEFITKLPSKGISALIKSFASNSALTSAFEILGSSAVSYQATNITGWIIQFTAPQFVPMITFAAGRFGVNIGLTAVNALTPAATAALETGAIAGVAATGEVAGAAVAGTIAGEAAGVAAGTAITTAGAVAGAGAGATAGGTIGALSGPLAPLVIPILTAIGAALGKVIDKVKIWIKRNPNAIRYMTLLPLIAGIAIGSIPIIVVSGFFFVSTFVATGGVMGAAGAMGGFLTASFFAIIGATINSIAKPLILSLLGTVAFVALVFFIINSGAYVVPPDTGSSINIDQNPYISVSKVADISSAPNPNPTITVNYTVTVSAPQGSISNIVFQNGCTVVKNGGSPTCSAPLPPETPAIIDPTSPFVFKYSQTYDSKYTDSLVTDTFSVTATTPQGQGNSLSSASVIIGNPPTKCFNVAGSNWPSEYKSNVLSAVATLNGSFPAYSAKLCSGGTIKVVYDTTKNPGGWGYYSGGTIYLNGGGLKSSINSLYILSHESGHHYQSSTLAGIAAMVQYLNNTGGVAGERPLCSYVNTGNPYEAFAEAIALYVTRDQSSQWTNKCGGTFQSTYPNHYNFVRNNIF